MLPETHFHRQLTLLPPDKSKTPITIIGAGGIGSVTSLCLAKIGCSDLTVFDDDTVENENVPSQYFSPGQIGVPKSIAVADNVMHMIGTPVHAYDRKWTTNENVTPIVISAVDSMAVRKEIYDFLKTRYDVQLYIDARMGGEKMRIYAIQPGDPDQQKKYETTLYTDEQANEEECTAKAIAYNTFVIAGIIASLVKHKMMDQPVPLEVIFDLNTYGFLKSN